MSGFDLLYVGLGISTFWVVFYLKGILAEAQAIRKLLERQERRETAYGFPMLEDTPNVFKRLVQEENE
jgi:hypothetical protein